MSFVRHKETVPFLLNLEISKTTHNQLEVLRRSFEDKVQNLAGEAFAAAVQDLFDRRMMEIGALPGFDVAESESEAA